MDGVYKYGDELKKVSCRRMYKYDIFYMKFKYKLSLCVVYINM